MHTETTVWLDGVTPEVPPVPVPYRPRLLRLGDLTLVLPEDAVASAEMTDELIACLNIIRSNALRELALRDAEWTATLPFDEEAVGAAERTERDEADGPDDAHNPYLTDGGAGDSGYRASMADAGRGASIK